MFSIKSTVLDFKVYSLSLGILLKPVRSFGKTNALKSTVYRHFGETSWSGFPPRRQCAYISNSSTTSHAARQYNS